MHTASPDDPQMITRITSQVKELILSRPGILSSEIIDSFDFMDAWTILEILDKLKEMEEIK